MKGLVHWWPFAFNISIAITSNLDAVYNEEQERKKNREDNGRASWSALNKLRVLILNASTLYLFDSEEFYNCIKRTGKLVLRKANKYISVRISHDYHPSIINTHCNFSPQENEDLSGHIAEFKRREAAIALIENEDRKTTLVATIFISGFDETGQHKKEFEEDGDELKNLRLNEEFLRISFQYRYDEC